MNNNSIFSDSFLANLSSVLETSCADNKSVSSSVVCAALELPSDLKHTIGIAVNMGLVPNFKVSAGRGIYKDTPEDATATTNPKVKKNARLKRATDDKAEPQQAKASKLTEEFLTLLRTTLEDLCASSDRPVPRKLVSEAMNMAGIKTELMISEALKLDSFSDFKIRPGRAGGIVFAAEALQEDDDNVVVLPEEDLDIDVALTMPDSEDGEVFSEL
jgi:hypothetical protein